ncbi:HAD-IC family P-type ATPase [Arthrobacter antioxidans]|uniref:HAD-IC family P-type ATPase n=1 Tax=Arthrobacter antioxidans TaxID=2895818 RepID=UPI001FFF64B2|nr:HAD-IC family P-type ATPase [Arthrobacter antioxidans]
MPADRTGRAPATGAGRESALPTVGAWQGLSTAEVLDRTERGLVNTSPDSTGRSFASILQANVLTLFNAVVGGCFLALVLLGAWQDALFGFFIVANTLIGVVQEFTAKRALVRLAVLNAPRAYVRRDGVDAECAVDAVVLDDLLVLRPGEQVPADAELVECRALEVDESLLTGEAVPVPVTVGRGLMSGSTIVAGAGLARVTGVGAESYAARITAEARQFSLVDSELRRSIGRVIHWISLGLLPLSVIVVNGQMQAAGGWSAALASGAWRDATITAVASINAMVPAGLVFMTSVALAVGAARLARRRVLIRELAAVEGLARVDVLCIDKTGTLTEGSFALDRLEAVEGAPAGWRQALAWFATDPAANATALAIGSGVPGAWAGSAPPDATVAFSSRHRWSGAHFAEDGLRGSWVLGGADVVLGAAGPGSSIVAQAAAIAASGTRTLILAHSSRPLPLTGGSTAPILPDGLRPVAMAVLRERVRPDAADTLRYFGEQGVRVVVISGDDPGTVLAVARQVRLPGASSGVDARTLPEDPEGLAEVLRTESVFGRVSPDRKKAMVLALQSLGHTVAMTGDGINDALALKHADLGIAMGSGAPAARAVANLVLLDGDFARLPGIVAEGRQVIANVERLAKLFLSKTVYAVLLALVFGVLLWPFPFLPRQLAVVDGLTIGLPALVLGLLPNTRRYRPGFLRRVGRWCIPSGIVVAFAVFGAVAYARGPAGASTAVIQTVAVITLTLSALWVLAVLARPFTRTTAGVVVAAYAGLPLILALPAARAFLQLEIPPPELVVVAVAASAAAGVVLEVVHRRIRSRPGAL